MKLALLLWHHHGDNNTAFQPKVANLLVTQPPFMALCSKKLNELFSYWDNEITLHLFHILLELLLWDFDMENREILGFQFKPTKMLQPDSSSNESWETCSTDSEPNTTEQNKASVDTWCICLNCSQMPTKKEHLCCHELDACNYFKIKGFYIYLLTMLQVFFYQTNQWTRCYELNPSSRKWKVFFICYEYLYLSQFLLSILHKTLFFYMKLTYKNLALRWLKN